MGDAMTRFAKLAMPLVLMACAGQPVVTPSVPKASGLEGRRLAECQVLELAYAETKARGLLAPQDILVGCPGREGFRDEMPLKAQSAALRAANQSQLPAEVARSGVQAGIAYRRMITRGVPEAVARDIARGARVQAISGLGPLTYRQDIPTCPGETVALCK